MDTPTPVRFFTCADAACTDSHADTGTSRREFLQTAGCFGMALALFGIGTRDAVALPVGTTSGEGSGSEKRYPLPAGESVNIDHSAGLIVARYQNHVMVFSLACPHENNAVKWVAKDHRFACTKHDSKYSPDGAHIEGRATRNMDRYVIRRDGDSVLVDLHKWVQSDKAPAGWAAAQIAV
jgi:nitrite reductase/ring-hydroxylating ferredoxin subunit